MDTQNNPDNPDNLPVMDFDHATGQYTYRDWTPEEKAENDERALIPPTP